MSPAQRALALAVRSLDINGARAALAQGADPNGAEDVAISPLVSVFVSIQAWIDNASDKQEQMILLLLDAGARPEWAGRDGKNPYELALRQGWARVVEKMLEKGAGADRVGLGGPTPLQFALTPTEYKGWPLLPIVQSLLAAGADPLLSSRQQPPPLVLGLRSRILADAPDLQEALLDILSAGGIPESEGDPAALVDLANDRGFGVLADRLRTLTP